MSSPVRHPYHQPLKLFVNVAILVTMTMVFWVMEPTSLGNLEVRLSLILSVVCALVPVVLVRLERFDQLSTILTLIALVLSTFGVVICSGGLHSPILYALPILVLLAAILTAYKETVLFSLALALSAVFAILQIDSLPVVISTESLVFQIWMMALTGLVLIVVVDRQHQQQTDTLWTQLDTNEKLQWLLACEERHSEQLVHTLTDNIKREQSVFDGYYAQAVNADPDHALVKPLQLLISQMKQLASYVETEQSVLVESQPTSLVSVCESMVELFSRHPHPDAVEVHLNLNHDPGDFLCVDLPRLEQVWMNLFRNALESTQSGQIRIDLMKENGCYRFQFFDTGCGIPASEQDRIFQIFEQGRPRAQTEGLGIGLALATTVLRSFGSRLYLKSIEKRGTLFWFFIDTVAEGAMYDRPD